MAFKDNITINKAWDNLHQRLESDGLLPENNRLLPENDGLLPKGDGPPPGNILDSRKLRQVIHLRIFNAAAFLAACIFSVWYFTREANFPEKDMLVLNNEASAPTLATMLEDGSVVYLSEQTSLKYPDRFADNKREVALQGNAFFDINRQPERPFFIDTDLAKVEVFGTSFSIKNNDRYSFLLSVREGEVRVTKKSNKQVIAVKTGESVILDSEQFQLVKNATMFDEYFKHIHFKDEQLVNVANIINTHSVSTKLRIDPEVTTRSITFTLSMESDIAEIAKVMCMALNLQYSQQENTIYISK